MQVRVCYFILQWFCSVKFIIGHRYVTQNNCKCLFQILKVQRCRLYDWVTFPCMWSGRRWRVQPSTHSSLRTKSTNREWEPHRTIIILRLISTPRPPTASGSQPKMPRIKAVTPYQCAEPLVPPSETPEILLNINWTYFHYKFVFSAVTALASITEMSPSISEHIRCKKLIKNKVITIAKL